MSLQERGAAVVDCFQPACNLCTGTTEHKEQAPEVQKLVHLFLELLLAGSFVLCVCFVNVHPIMCVLYTGIGH